MDWKNLKKETNGKLNYTTFEKNKIIFSYNIIDIKNLEKPELENNKTKLAEELIKMKNKYFSKEFLTEFLFLCYLMLSS